MHHSQPPQSEQPQPAVVLGQHIRKGYFVDMQYMQRNQYYEWEIYQISNTKIYLKNTRQDTSRYVVDMSPTSTVTAHKLLPFRTISKPTQILTSYHKLYSFWCPGFQQALNRITQFSQPPQQHNIKLYEQHRDVHQIVQFMKGVNYYAVCSMNDNSNRVNSDNVHMVRKYITMFLGLVARFISEFQVEEKDMGVIGAGDIGALLYSSPKMAVMLSFPQILMCLNVLFTRRNFLQVVTNQYLAQDPSTTEQLCWLQRTLIPILKHKLGIPFSIANTIESKSNVLANAQAINVQDIAICKIVPFEMCIKLVLILLKVCNNKKIGKQVVMDVVVQLIRKIPETFQYMPYGRFVEVLAKINDVIQCIQKTQPQFLLILICKLKLLLRLQECLQQSIVPMQDKITALFRHANFVLFCVDYFHSQNSHDSSVHKELQELVFQYLKHKNGIPFYVRNSNMSHAKELGKVFRLAPKMFLTTCLQENKTDLFRIIDWSLTHLWVLLNIWLQMLNTQKQKQKQKQKQRQKQKEHLIISKNVHQLISNELSTKYNPKQKQSSPFSSTASPPIPPLPLSAQDQQILHQIQQMLKILQHHIIGLCWVLYDNEKTMTIDYIEKNIVDKYIRDNQDSVAVWMHSKDANCFRENILIKHYLSRMFPVHKPSQITTSSLQPSYSEHSASYSQSHGTYSQSHASQPLSPTFTFPSLLQHFTSLCQSLPYLKTKSSLDSRKQNLVFLLTKCLNFYPSELIPLICSYIQATQQTSNRQFKFRCLQPIPTMLTRNTLWSSQQHKLQSYKNMIQYIKIESIGVLRIFMEMFKYISHSQNTCRLTVEESNQILVVFREPYCFGKIVEGLAANAQDRTLVKKLVGVLARVHLKVVREEDRVGIVRMVVMFVLACIAKIGAKAQVPRLQQDYLNDLVQLLYDYYNNTPNPSTTVLSPQSQYLRTFRTIPYSPLHTQARPLKLKILLQADINCQQVSLIADDIEQLQNTNKVIQQQYNITINSEQALYAIKGKACAHFQILPMLSNFYYSGKRVLHEQEVMMLGEFVEMHKNTIGEADRRNQDNKDTDRQNQDNKDTDRQNQDNKDITESMQEKNADDVVLVLRAQKMESTALDLSMENLDILFVGLPYTQKIWNYLQIAPQIWSHDAKLIAVKNQFLSSYNQSCLNQSEHTCAWKTIIEQPLKKKHLFQGLVADPNLKSYSFPWLLTSFAYIDCLQSLQSNIQSFSLVQTLSILPATPKCLQLLLCKHLPIKHSKSSQFQLLQKNQKTYNNYIQRLFQYIENNQTKLQFQLFEFFMGIDKEFYVELVNHTVFADVVGAAFVRGFERVVGKMDEDGLFATMREYVAEYPQNFQYFFTVFEKYDNVYSEDVKNKFQKWLQKTIDHVVNMQASQQPLTTSELHTHLQLIQTLVLKKIYTPSLLSTEFRSLLHSLLHSKNCNVAISIITALMTISSLHPSQSPSSFQSIDYYIKYFQSQLQGPQLQKKQHLKFSKTSLKHQSGFVGLTNPHSICYINSLLQQLFHIKKFRQQLLKTKWKKNTMQNIQQDLIYQLKKIFINLQMRECDSYINRDFFQAFKNDQGSATSLEVQMDVDQFKNILFDRIENLIVKPENQSKNFIQQLFNFKQVTKIQSKQCSHISSKQQDFTYICLQVKGLKTLQSSLEHYFKPQILSQDNKYFCEDCNKKVIAQKTHYIKEYPQYLTFVLKRFDYMFQYKRKVNEKFEFQMGDMWMGGGENDGDHRVRYRLKGVIVHQGLSQAGHYFSMIKINEKWYEFNDNYVGETTEKDVATESYGQSTARSNRNAYLLIYQRYNEPEMISQNIKLEPNNESPEQQYYGLDEQIEMIRRHNSLTWKLELFLSEQFNNFVYQCLSNNLPGSHTLTFQYLSTIKTKQSKPDFLTIKTLLTLLLPPNPSPSTPALSSIPRPDYFSSQTNIQHILKFYKYHPFNSSIKSLMTKVLVINYQKFTTNVKKFMVQCLMALHEEVQTAVFYQLFLQFGKKDKQVLVFLCVNGLLVGRIFQVSFIQVLLSLDRSQLSKSSEYQFRMLDSSFFMKKKALQNPELRYHKYKLLNHILLQSVPLTKIQTSYMQQWSSRKCQQIFEQAITKSIINQISIFFCILAQKNVTFGVSYLQQLKEQIQKDRSQNYRKYMKAVVDLLAVEGQMQGERVRVIKECFRGSFEVLYRQKIMSSFDVKWQWFMKIMIRNKCFRNAVLAAPQQFKLLTSRQQLQTLYLSRNQINSQGKNKNKYYGLRFPTQTSTNLEQKLQKSRNIFSRLPEHTLAYLQHEQQHLQTDLTTYPQIQIKPKQIILKYCDALQAFKEIVVEDVIGNCLFVQNTIGGIDMVDRGCEKFMFVRESVGNIVGKLEEVKEEEEGDDSAYIRNLD